MESLYNMLRRGHSHLNENIRVLSIDYMLKSNQNRLQDKNEYKRLLINYIKFTFVVFIERLHFKVILPIHA